MEIIAMESEAYKNFLKKIDEINQKLDDFKRKSETPLSELWIDNSELCIVLKISKRKAQEMRDACKIPFSKIDGKIYYRASDVEKLLEQNYKG